MSTISNTYLDIKINVPVCIFHFATIIYANADKNGGLALLLAMHNYEDDIFVSMAILLLYFYTCSQCKTLGMQKLRRSMKPKCLPAGFLQSLTVKGM